MTHAAPPLVLSVFASFRIGGPQVRFAAVANHFGPALRHAIVSMDGRHDCAQRLASHLDVSFPVVETRRRAILANVSEFRRVLADLAPDVLVTHNWGSIEWVLANLASERTHHVHIEDGFGPEEADHQIRRRVLARRVLLRRSTVVLPSLTLLKIAQETWRLPEARLRYVPNGVDLARFSPVEAAPEGPPRIATVAALRPEKNLARLLRAAKLLLQQGRTLRLTFVGDGPERARLQGLAEELGIGRAVVFAGAMQDPALAYREIDIFALSSDTEQMPLSVLDAMGAGLPVAATAVGDVPQMLARENQPFLCGRNDAALADALARLLSNPGLRRRVGAANRLKAERDYDQCRMFQRYGELLRLLPAQGKEPAGT